jgi:WD40 repeat protein|eukprot:COSAG06_NODE_6137_length_3091_cov_3.263703_1_plen_127_part_00
MGICGSKPAGEPKPTASGVSEGVPPDDTVSQCVLTLEGHSYTVWSVSFSPDGARIVSASDKTVRVWNAATGECELTLEGHSGAVRSACFSPDGARIVSSASRDKTVRVWNAATGACEPRWRNTAVG